MATPTALPIWQDIIVTLSNGAAYGSAGEGYLFRIIIDGDQVIYTGRSYLKPGETNAKVRINNILADYFNYFMPLTLDGGDYYEHIFEVEQYNIEDEIWEAWSSIDVCRDWSYERTSVPLTASAQFAPITDEIHPLQYLPLWMDAGGGSITFNYSSTTAVATPTVDHGHFYFYNLAAETPGFLSVDANGRNYKVGNYCGGYVLYYINAYGGWDSLVVSGRVVRTDGITHYTRDVVYDNSNPRNRGRENYVNEIAPVLHITIGPLTTDQSSRMHHLLESPCVYVHDITRGTIRPLVLKNSSVEHKVRPGILHIYEFDAEIAQNFIRR